MGHGVKRSERITGEEKAAWLAAVEEIGEAISLVDLDGRVLHYNAAFQRLAPDVADPKGRFCCTIASGCDEPPHDCPLRRMGVSGRRETSEICHGGHWHRCTVQPMSEDDGTVTGAVCVVTDLTPAKQSDERLARLSRMHALVGNPTAALFRARDRQTIFEQVCQLAVEQGGLRLAWVGLFDATKERLVPVADAGFSNGYVDLIRSANPGSHVQCPLVREVAETGMAAICDDIASDPRLAAIREEALRRGYRAMGVFPLRNQADLLGLLCLYTDSAGFFTEQETALLEELARNVSLAVDLVTRDEQRREAEAALMRSEERFQSLLQFASDLLVVLSPEARILFVSPSVTHLLGYSAEEVLGRSVFEFVHPEDSDLLQAAWRDTVADPNDTTQHEFRMRHKGGSWRILQTVGSRIMPDASMGGIIVNARDVTEKRASDHMLRLLSSALQAAANGVLITDRSGTILWVNAAFSALTGYSAAEVVGQNPRVLKSGSHPLSFYEQLWQTILAGRVWRGELVNRRKDGTLYNEEMTITPVPDAQNRVTHFVAIKQDITKRKQTEERIREQAVLLEIAPQAIVVRDLDDKIVFWNRGAEETFGLTAASVVGQTAREVLPFADPAELHAALEIVRATGFWRGEMAMNIGGQRHLLDCHWTLIHDEHGAPKSILCVDTDVTEKQRIDEYLSQSQRLDSIGTLVSGIAHDFNNILMPILGLSDILLTMPNALDNKEEARDALVNINAAARDAREIVRRLREFYRPNETSSLIPVEVQRIVVDALLLTQPRWKTQAEAEGRHIEVRTNVRGNPTLLGNESQIREAMTNLILNAVDAMPAGGVLSIEGYARDGFIFIEVCDTGIGMTEEVQRRCLEPFFTTKGASGSGLGLSMCHGIVQRHMGSLHIQSEPGRTVIRLRFPSSHASPTASNESQPDRPAGHGDRVLIVDDEEMSRRLLGEYLEADGYIIDVAASGREALRKLQSARYDLLITDRAMPHMNGDLVAIEARRVAPDMPILMVTGFGDLMLAGSGPPPGVDAIAAKPLSKKELCAVAFDLLRKSDMA